LIVGRARTAWHELRAARVIRCGGVIVHATEGVFGLACLAMHRGACSRLAALKRRPREKGFIVIAARAEQFGDIVRFEGPYMREVAASWPGPHTWIFPAGAGAPEWLRGPQKTVAVRVTAHPQAAVLCDLAGPMLSTSANPAGREPARDLFRARRYFGSDVDIYLPGAIGPRQRPSTIRDARTGAVIRS
jgi:L-threonylcarbamoyladenylate synthase